MLKNMKIAFDFKNSKEYVTKFVINEYTEIEKIPEKYRYRKFYIIKDTETICQDIGTFFLDFMNTDFDDYSDCAHLLEKYLYVNLLFDYKPKILTNCYFREGQKIDPSDIDDLELILTEQEIQAFAIIFFEDNNINYNASQYMLENVFENKYFNLLLKLTNFMDDDYDLYEKLSETEKDYCGIKHLSKFFKDVKMSYDLKNFPDNSNLQTCYYSNNPIDLVYLSARELYNNKKNFRICKCENCGYYFMPKTSRPTKYCDQIFENGKTCKEYANSMAFGKDYNNDPVCIKYRNRYKNLQKKARESNKFRSTELYEKYQIDGPTYLEKYKLGKITAEEFENWIDSMKIRK